MTPAGIKGLAPKIVACRACPRLVAYHAGIQAENPSWHCQPVPGFGDPEAKVLLIGLAPSKTGGNRTSRIFTGDKTGDYLYDALYKSGYSSSPLSRQAGDGLRLFGLYLTPALKCAPPGDKPTPEELKRCFHFLEEETALLPKVKVVIALGKIAHDAYVKLRGQKPSKMVFAHGAVHRFPERPQFLLDTYHCSPRNTNTRRLTKSMLLAILSRSKALAKVGKAA